MKIRQFTLTLVVAAVAVGLVPTYAQAQAKPVGPAAKLAPGAHPQASCLGQIKNERMRFEQAMAAGMKSGRIDAKESEALKKTHAELMEMEKKAMADQKVSAEECKAIHDKIVAEHKQLQAAMASPGGKAPAHAAPPLVKGPAPMAGRPAPGAHPQAGCIGQIRNERAGFEKRMAAGMKSGRIDAKEQEMLKKTHAELMAMEKKASEDHKISPAECKAIHDKIVAEHKQLAAAMASPAGKAPVPAAPKGK